MYLLNLIVPIVGFFFLKKEYLKVLYLQEAAKMVQPSSRREGFSSIPNVKWEDVGGLDFLRQEFDRYIVRRIKFPEDYVVIIDGCYLFILSLLSIKGEG